MPDLFAARLPPLAVPGDANVHGDANDMLAVIASRSAGRSGGVRSVVMRDDALQSAPATARAPPSVRGSLSVAFSDITSVAAATSRTSVTARFNSSRKRTLQSFRVTSRYSRNLLTGVPSRSVAAEERAAEEDLLARLQQIPRLCPQTGQLVGKGTCGATLARALDNVLMPGPPGCGVASSVPIRRGRSNRWSHVIGRPSRA